MYSVLCLLCRAPIECYVRVTAAELPLEVGNVTEQAASVQGTEDTERRLLVEDDEHWVSGDSNRCLTECAKPKLDQHHQSAKVFYCDICGMKCCSKSHIITHMRIHTGERPYACKVCKKAFMQCGTLMRHMRTHTGERPHACKVCKRAFSCGDKLITHMRTHTGEKPYACKVCKRAFSECSNLTRRMRTHSMT
jgi:glass-like protein